tara:strand:- start:16020 stop:17057 length:1038 start_codon:yes stop_codon:yes gene_type:complete
MQLKKILVIVALIGLIIFAIFSFFVYRIAFMSNTSFESDSVNLFIKNNISYEQFLEQIDPFILDVDDFHLWAKQKNYKLKPGKYIIRKGMNNNQIINTLRSKSVTVNVIFNNIKSLNELAGKISQQIEADSISFIKSFDTDFFAKNGFDKKNILSMYIPNSYNFYWNTSAEKFNSKLFEEYNKFWQKNNRANKANEIGLSKTEVMILASIVFEESKKNIEQPKIAGVYINRLRSNWKLQADPTVKFAAYQLDQYKNTVIRRVLNKHLKINSPYNTYKYFGLPPGIISMPSIQAIDAVLNYEKHNYYFFAADPTNPGYHSFASSLSEHSKNARKFHKYLNSQGIKK